MVKKRGVKATVKVKHSSHKSSKKIPTKFIKTGIEGFDALFEKGIPKGSTCIIAGGAGSGKTILSMQILKQHVANGDKCLYMSFEESEKRLINHMEDFGWEPDEMIKSGNLVIKRFNPFDITRSVDALLMKAKGELMIDVAPYFGGRCFCFTSLSTRYSDTFSGEGGISPIFMRAAWAESMTAQYKSNVA